MLVSAAGFRGLAERVARLADELTDGRLVAATEGGYSPIYNPFCLLGVLEGLAGQSAEIDDPYHDDPSVRAARAGADADPGVRADAGAGAGPEATADTAARAPEPAFTAARQEPS
jgi:hypothetical protein